MYSDSNGFDPFGTILKTFRLSKHLTQQQLADKLGVRRNTIGGWERGECLPGAKATVLELARHLRLGDQETRQLLEASLTALPPPWSVPFSRNPFFTGREEIMKALHAQISTKQMTALTQSYALHGLGGVGKTQIALEYAYRHALEYSAVFWIGAETDEQIVTSLLRIAEALQLPMREDQDQQRVVAAVQHWLISHDQWLLIWDNVENLETLDRFLPSTRSGAILITTRCQTLGTFAYGLDLSPMEQKESVTFLLRRAKVLKPGPEGVAEQVQQFAMRAPAEYAAAVELVTAMEGLPLALDQVGAYLEETGCSFSDYLQRYEQQRASLLNRRGRPRGGHPSSVTATIRLANQRVVQDYPQAANLLRLCALLSAEGIPEELFVAHISSSEATGDCGVKDLYQLDEAIAALRSFSLVQRHSETRTLSIHRLVQAVLWEEMSEQERHLWQWRAIRSLNAAFPEIIPENWPQCERFLPHLLTCAAAIPHDELDQDLAEILRKTADYLRGRARFEQAGPLYRRALHIEEQLHGPDQLRMAAPLYGLALLLFEQGKYMQAEPLARRALSIWERALQPGDTELARPLIGLAIVLFSQGKYAQTERLCQRALSLNEQALGSEHPQILPALINLADVSNEQGRYTEAEPLYRRAMRIQKQALGAEHPQLAYPLCGLGRLYTRQGREKQAKVLYQRAFQMRKRTLGAEHPYLAEPLTGLAIIAFRQGKDEQAEALSQQALRVGERTWGPKHPELVPTLLNLADLYAKQGKDEQAEALYRRVQSIWEQEVGMEHPLLAIALRGLAVLAVQYGRDEEAKALLHRALRIQEHLLGPDHPDTVRTLNRRASLSAKADAENRQARDQGADQYSYSCRDA